MHLLQCKTIFFIHLRFWGRNLEQIKEYPSWRAFTNIENPFFDSFTLVYIRLESSINSSTLVCICLHSSSNSSTLVYICLHSSTLIYWLVCGFRTDHIKTKPQKTCFFTSYKAFLKNKKRCWTSLSSLFYEWFLKKMKFFITSHYVTKMFCSTAFTSWEIGHHVYWNCLWPRLWRHKFWN